jgi:hypothetical protein
MNLQFLVHTSVCIVCNRFPVHLHMLILDLLVPFIEAVALRNDLLSVKRESNRQSHIEGDANFLLIATQENKRLIGELV